MIRAAIRLTLPVLTLMTCALLCAADSDDIEFEQVAPPDKETLDQARKEMEADESDDVDASDKADKLPDQSLRSWDESVARGIEDVSTLGNRLKPIEIGVDVLPYGFSRSEDQKNLRLRLYPTLRVPFLEKGAVDLDEVNFKLGRLYLDATDLTFSILASDNVNHTEKNTQSDVIGSASLGINVLYELTDESHLTFQGALVWLPFEGEFGVDGFGVRDVYSLGFANLMDAGLLLDGRIGGVDVTFKDDLFVRDNRLESELSGDFSLYDGEDFTETDTAGDYHFGGSKFYDPYFDSDKTLEDNDTIEIVNTASVTGLKEVLEESQASVTAFYRNYWYPDKPEKETYLITREYGLNAAWVCDRTNWRFNPFGYYSQVWNNVDQGWLYTARAGAQGSLTDQIHLYGDVGWGQSEFMDGDDGFLWRFAVNHDIGPVTNQRALYERRFEGRGRSLQTRFRYELQHIFSNRLRGGLFGGWTDYELGNDRTGYLTDIYGAELFVQVTPVVGFLQEIISHGTTYENDAWTDAELYRSTLSYIINKNNYLAFTYSHKFQTSSGRDSSFRENLFILSWVIRL